MVLRKYFRTHYVNIENARANAQHTAQHKHILFAFGETVYFAQIFTNEVWNLHIWWVNIVRLYAVYDVCNVCSVCMKRNWVEHELCVCVCAIYV